MPATTVGAAHLVQLEWHQDAQCPKDPEGAVGQEEDLSPPFAGILCQPEALSADAGFGSCSSDRQQ